MKAIFLKYWFLFGLFSVAFVTLADTTETVATAGSWIGGHRGPDVLVFLIFLLSGLSLADGQIKQGASDLSTVAAAIVIIFVLAPLAAAVIGQIPLSTGMRIGLFIVAIMPTTLSSGVVMTGAAGGNPANALMITIVANILGIFTIPFSLQILAGSAAGPQGIELNKAALMLQIALLVIVPLFIGLAARGPILPVLQRMGIKPGIVNQLFILTMVWIGLSRSRPTIVSSLHLLGAAVLLAFGFHAVLLAITFLMSRLFRFGPGRREAVIFMGGQKTLPLSVLIQTTLFPQYGQALVFCVMHHMVHLFMDGYLVGKLAPRKGNEGSALMGNSGK